jgi:hypothetical protein
VNQPVLSPRIIELSWGRLQVEGYGTLKDAKLFPGGARAWDWNETGTGHAAGIQPADVEELLERGATIVVLSTGVNRRLQVCHQTLQMLNARQISAHVLQTEDAVRLYNTLRENEPVGGLFHSTC